MRLTLRAGGARVNSEAGPAGTCGRERAVHLMSREFRRALGYLVPYWRQLALVVLLSGLNTALTLTLPI